MPTTFSVSYCHDRGTVLCTTVFH